MKINTTYIINTFKKKIYRHLGVCCIFFLVLFNCCSIKEKNVAPLKETIQISIGNEIHTNCSFVKEARFVFLDSKVPIGNINKLRISNNKIIIHDGISEKINIYDKTGKYLHTIQCKGRGKGEYYSLSDFTINDTDHSVIILDSKKRKLLFYSLNDGTFINEIEIDFRPTKIAFMDDFILLYNPFVFNYSTEEYKYSLCVLDKNGKLLDKFLKNDNFYGNIRLSNRALYHNSSHIIFNNKLSNRIYNFNDGKLLETYVVNFKQNKDFENYLKNNVKGRIGNTLLKTKYCYDIDNICETNNLLFFNYIKGNKLFYTIIDKSSSNVLINDPTNVTLSNVLVNNKIPLFSYPSYCYKNEFISIFEPEVIKRQYNNRNVIIPNEENKALIERFKNLNFNDNPVIGFYKYQF